MLNNLFHPGHNIILPIFCLIYIIHRRFTINPKLYEYNGVLYPSYLKHFHASKYIIPFAKEFCKGDGLDIGGTNDCHFPGATIINTDRNDPFDAYHLPDRHYFSYKSEESFSECRSGANIEGFYDFIFSSHTLEHLVKPYCALDLWIRYLKPGGVLFLYLPHPDMSYWHPQTCHKHNYIFTPLQIRAFVTVIGLTDIIMSERDLYWSFSLVGFKP